MRLSTSMMYNQQMKGISDAQSAWMKVGEQLSTGKRVINPSDDPVASSRAVVLAQAQAESSQYGLARTFATQNISLEENVLSNVTSSIQDAQQLIVFAGNGTLSDDDRASVATQLEGIRAQLLNQANTTDGNGRYIFAGYSSNLPPFADVDGGVSYVGGKEAITQKVDISRTMTVSHTGEAVFMSITGNAVKEPSGDPADSEANLFNMLDGAIAALRTPVANADQATKDAAVAAIDKTNRGLRNSLNNVLSVRSELGTQLDELDKLDAQAGDRNLILSNQMSNLVDVDYNSVISSYMMQQTALQASYKTFSDMSGMSLFQLNR
ncbi:flagellar hook protein FlgL [[Pantoea] beijingensis]|uniref:Flagellar hook protein FlgL n=1 Tax=[Pantoea] beijingensis TaxID=1324864 RepID=A0A443ICS3_9GAMM|nr:flagellar hook-associated protein FlgL [[Pantoea] beijingensis]RWR01919.1 flagellar hook protein FlgL [[Pantoea] beijingensis]